MQQKSIEINCGDLILKVKRMKNRFFIHNLLTIKI